MKQIDRDFFRTMVAQRAEALALTPTESVDENAQLIRRACVKLDQMTSDEDARRLELLVEVAALAERGAVDVILPRCSTRNKVDALKQSSSSRRSARAVSTRGICRVCGCTDLKACPGGCHWADEAHTLCSNCGPKPVQPAHKATKKGRTND